MRIVRFASAAVFIVAALVPTSTANATFPGANGDLAFGRKDDVWIVDPGTGDLTRLTTTKRAREMMPDWNASGTRIVYVRCGRGELSNCDLWVMNADGSGQTRLTTTPDAQETWPTWSPDGTKIAYTSDAEDPLQDIWVMNADGSGQTRLTTTAGFDAFAEWSPDGSKIVFTSDRAALDDLWVMDPDGSNPVRLTTGDGRIDERPDWSPDGSQIVFSRNGNVWVMDADGSNASRVTSNKQFEFGPTFSPDGSRIAFNRQAKNGRIGVWLVNVDGTGRTKLTTGPLDFFPDWQPV